MLQHEDVESISWFFPIPSPLQYPEWDNIINSRIENEIQTTSHSSKSNPVWLWTDGSSTSSHFNDAGYSIVTDRFSDSATRVSAIENDLINADNFQVLCCSKFPGRQTVARAE